jgi:hypothetical protein
MPELTATNRDRPIPSAARPGSALRSSGAFHGSAALTAADTPVHPEVRVGGNAIRNRNPNRSHTKFLTLPEVVLMGEETHIPRPPHPHADKTARRRFTDIWTPTSQGWRLSVRQATVLEAR